MAIPNQLDEDIDFSDIEEKCVTAAITGWSFNMFRTGTRSASKTVLTTS